VLLITLVEGMDGQQLCRHLSPQKIPISESAVFQTDHEVTSRIKLLGLLKSSVEISGTDGFGPPMKGRSASGGSFRPNGSRNARPRNWTCIAVESFRMESATVFRTFAAIYFA
jgi:hypothetical protein